MARTGNRARRFLIGGLVALVVVVGGGALALRVILTPERLRTETIRMTKDATGLDVELESASLSMTPFGVRLKELRIAGEKADDPPFLTLASAMVRLNLAPLLARNVVVEQVSLERPVLSVSKEGQVVMLPGKLRAAPRAAPESESLKVRGVGQAAQKFRGEIELLEVTDGVVRVLTPGGLEDMELSGINVRANLTASAGADRVQSRGELHLAGLSLAALEAYRETLDRLAPVVHFDLDYRPTVGSLSIVELRLAAAPLDLRFTGELAGLPAEPTLTLSLAPQTVSMEELLPLVPPSVFPEGRVPTARGPVTISAHVEGRLGDPASPPDVQTQVRFDGAEFGMDGFPVSVSAVRGNVVATAGSLELSELTATLGTGTLALNGRVNGTDHPETATFDVNVDADLDLGIVEQAGLAPEGTRLGGQMTARTRVQGATGQPDSTRLSGTVTLSEGSYQTAEMPVALTGLFGKAELAGSEVRIQDVKALLGQSRFTGSGKVTQALTDPFVTFEGHSPRLDLTEWMPDPAVVASARAAVKAGQAAPPPVRPLIPLIPPIRAELKLGVDSLLTVDGALYQVELVTRLADSKARIDATAARGTFGPGVVMNKLVAGVDVEGQTMRGNFRSVEVNSHKVPLTNVTGNLQLTEERVLSFRDVKAAVWTGALEGSANVDLTIPGEPAFEITTKGRGLQANDFVSTLTPAKNFLFGTLDIESSFSGRGATPEEITKTLLGNGTVNAREGRVNRGPQVDAIWNALNLSGKESIPFQDLVTAFSIREGRLVTDDLALAGKEAVWKANGYVGFDGLMDYKMQVELGDELSAQFRQRVGTDLAALLAGTQGRIVLDLAVDGPVAKPRVSLDRTQLALRAKENAANALQKEIERGKEKIGDKLKGLLGGR